MHVQYEINGKLKLIKDLKCRILNLQTKRHKTEMKIEKSEQIPESKREPILRRWLISLDGINATIKHKQICINTARQRIIVLREQIRQINDKEKSDFSLPFRNRN